MRKMLERTIPKMIDIQLIVDRDIGTINADTTQMDQVLMNLAVNARDAMPEGGKLLIETADIVLDEEYAGTHLDAKPGRYVLLMVTDTGSGMDKDTLEHIFEPFYTTKGVGEGTGLGLAMVHGIVQQHGGHIICYSEPGKGTTFRIYFPALASAEKREKNAVGRMPSGGSETILLVDDDEFIRDLASRILTRVGYKILTASTGKEALEVYRARGHEVDMVLLDLIMPEMGGKQCLEGLLKLNPAVKVVIASGFSANVSTKEMLASQAKGFVNKPYDIRQLLGVVRSTLDEEVDRGDTT
jgi:CheY-like chemotaxis protein